MQPSPSCEPQVWRCIAYNVSAAGIGITLPDQLPEGTMLTIQAWDLPESRPLQARIVHSRPVESVWFTGCEWIKFLSDDELETWSGGPTDWVDHGDDSSMLIPPVQ